MRIKCCEEGRKKERKKEKEDEIFIDFRTGGLHNSNLEFG
jgi:hypothetical protein